MTDSLRAVASSAGLGPILPQTMKDRTLWTHKEAKWKPRNFQAAHVMFPAKGLHMPPPEPTINVHEQRKAEAEERKRKAEIAAKNIAEHQAANLPADKRELATSLQALVNKQARFILADREGKPCNKKSTVVYVWSEKKKGRTPQERGFITSDSLKTQPINRVNWQAVNWSLTNKQLAARYSCSVWPAARARKKYAPHTVNPNLSRSPKA